MAIYSLHHSTIGRSTHRAGTAGAHLGYVTRAGACSLVLGENMPLPVIGAKGGEARTWLDAAEEGDRKNARVVDKLTLALPVELSAEGRAELVRDFAHRLGQGRVPWLAGIHDRGKDEANPHAHLVLRDRDRETGKRVAGLSEKGSTERVRLLWEQAANHALAAMGSPARIDRRSLRAQGITDRAPQGHEGPAAQRIEAKGIPSTKLERIRAAREVRRDPRMPREASKSHQEAQDADRGLLAAQDALRASEGLLERATRNRDAAAEILDGRRELITGRLPLVSGRARLGILPPRTGPRLTEAEIAAEEHRALYCDADGHELIPYPLPFPQEYRDADAYRSARDAWDDAEQARIDRVAREKRAAWAGRLPELRRQLGATERAETILGRALEAARSLFDWMRERVATARSTLGADHETAQAMEADWLDAVADHPRTHGAVSQALLDAARTLERQTASVWDEGARLWREVEHRRRHQLDRSTRHDPGSGGPAGP